MRKTVITLILAICFFTISSFGEGMVLETKAATTASQNVKITANTINVRQEKSTDSKILCQISKDNIFELLEEGKDSQGKVWYKIDVDFGVTGWVAGWLCKKTNETVNSAAKSKSGELLYDCPDKDLFVKLLLLEDYSLKNLLKVYGSSYSIRQDNAYKKYKYKNGIIFEVSEDGDVITVGVGNRSVFINSLKKKTCDIFKNKGNEILIFEGSSLIVVDAASKKLLREYNTGCIEITDFEVGNFLDDNALELYIYGSDDNTKKRNIYKVTNDDFIKVYDINSFNFYGDGIKANINNKVLDLNMNIANYTANEKSIIPNRVFYNTEETTDKNKLLSIDPEWDVVQEKGKWYINVGYTVNITMLKYYWGPPDENMEYNEIMLNDLARINVWIDMSGKSPKIYKVLKKMKYNDDSLLNIKPMLFEEGTLPNGPELGMSMESAYKALGGDLKKYKYSENMELNGVQLQEFCGEIVGIYVESSKYTTKRGLKLGDSIKKVESMYGKPDVGFSGDDTVEYKFCYVTDAGEFRVNYYRSLTVYYKNGLVSAFNLYQVILE